MLKVKHLNLLLKGNLIMIIICYRNRIKYCRCTAIISYLDVDANVIILIIFILYRLYKMI
jgi:hypothetical protein